MLGIDLLPVLEGWAAELKEFHAVIYQDGKYKILTISGKCYRWEIHPVVVQSRPHPVPWVRLILHTQKRILSAAGPPFHMGMHDFVAYPWRYISREEWYTDGLLAYFEERLDTAPDFLEMFQDIIKHSPHEWDDTDDLVAIASKNGHGETARRIQKNIEAAGNIT